MAVNGIDSGTNNIYNSIFGTGSGSDSTGGMYSLGDYALIKSGSYKKLLKAYYATENEGTDKTESKEEEKKATASLLNTKTMAASLNNSLEDLRAKSLYEPTGKDENGKNTYDREKITKSVQSFVEDYNSYMESSVKLDSASILRKSVNMTKITSKNANLLSQIGIKIGENNKLTVDEEKLKNADISTVSSLFAGSGSYGDQIQNNARQSYQLANSQAYNNSHASSYTYNGSYSIMGTANGLMDRYL